MKSPTGRCASRVEEVGVRWSSLGADSCLPLSDLTWRTEFTGHGELHQWLPFVRDVLAQAAALSGEVLLMLLPWFVVVSKWS